MESVRSVFGLSKRGCCYPGSGIIESCPLCANTASPTTSNSVGLRILLPWSSSLYEVVLGLNPYIRAGTFDMHIDATIL